MVRATAAWPFLLGLFSILNWGLLLCSGAPSLLSAGTNGVLTAVELSSPLCAIEPGHVTPEQYLYFVVCPHSVTQLKMSFAAEGRIDDDSGNKGINSTVVYFGTGKDSHLVRLIVCKEAQRLETCTRYSIVASDRGSNETSLSVLDFSSSLSPLTPSFAPDVFTYSLELYKHFPVVLRAAAAADGLVALRGSSFVDSHSVVEEIVPETEEGTLILDVLSADGSNATTYTIHFVARDPPGPLLRSLRFEGGTLSPSFSPSTHFYTLKVPPPPSLTEETTWNVVGIFQEDSSAHQNETNRTGLQQRHPRAVNRSPLPPVSVRMECEAVDQAGYIQTTGELALQESSKRKNVSLEAGEFSVVETVTVSGANREGERRYVILVERESEDQGKGGRSAAGRGWGVGEHPPPDLLLRHLRTWGGEEMNEEFHPYRLTYSVTVPRNQSFIAFGAVPFDTSATVLVEGEKTKEYSSGWFLLERGSERTFNVTVKAGGEGKNVQLSYFVTVLRESPWYASGPWLRAVSSVFMWANLLLSASNPSSFVDTAKFMQFMILMSSIRGLPDPFVTFSSSFHEVSLRFQAPGWVLRSSDDKTMSDLEMEAERERSSDKGKRGEPVPPQPSSSSSSVQKPKGKDAASAELGGQDLVGKTAASERNPLETAESRLLLPADGEGLLSSDRRHDRTTLSPSPSRSLIALLTEGEGSFAPASSSLLASSSRSVRTSLREWVWERMGRLSSQQRQQVALMVTREALGLGYCRTAPGFSDGLDASASGLKPSLSLKLRGERRAKGFIQTLWSSVVDLCSFLVTGGGREEEDDREETDWRNVFGSGDRAALLLAAEIHQLLDISASHPFCAAASEVSPPEKRKKEGKAFGEWFLSIIFEPAFFLCPVGKSDLDGVLDLLVAQVEREREMKGAREECKEHSAPTRRTLVASSFSPSPSPLEGGLLAGSWRMAASAEEGMEGVWMSGEDEEGTLIEDEEESTELMGGESGESEGGGEEEGEEDEEGDEVLQEVQNHKGALAEGSPRARFGLPLPGHFSFSSYEEAPEDLQRAHEARNWEPEGPKAQAPPLEEQNSLLERLLWKEDSMTPLEIASVLFGVTALFLAAGVLYLPLWARFVRPRGVARGGRVWLDERRREDRGFDYTEDLQERKGTGVRQASYTALHPGPFWLFVLDFGLITFSQAAAVVLFSKRGADVEIVGFRVNTEDFRPFCWIALFVYPVGFIGYCTVKLIQISGLVEKTGRG
uniref:Cadherin-like beta sandwich domain-containing protein n=1 Tax=Chromera velia CCMP2878 TaxID=1169474 RepID=A0A0G4GGT9_9ALVE|eukprot:Cvel_21847.t1-p1 / transcript=Cvel_21847.t1 / gene=Cvel_21847 / organism=Chromera_velia_CCMP2878 / gene_product=hypothetical protein / transcript_product=hypothetical protein / location=Cvel_scaffold2087:14916-21628(-) / protein_length=1239 / sequence_SO=supercontig / SO=protein_coding / is_pseudo=false